MGCGKSQPEDENVQKDRRRLSVSKSEAVVNEGDDKRDRFNHAAEDSLLEMFPDADRRLSLQGQKSDNTQKGFDNKQCAKQGNADIEPAELGIGFACKKGLKPESPNQDDFFILRVDDWGLYGVFDGHGPYGHDVSGFVHETLPGLLVRDGSFQSDPSKAQTNGYKRVHQLVEQAGQKGRFDPSLSGTTCTTIIYRNKNLHMAHVGDSRAVLSKKVDGKDVAMNLTEDHKPENPAEKKRIHANGGEVKHLEGDVPHRVFLKGKRYPGLAMSRSLGDLVGQSAGVSHVPEVRDLPVEDNFSFFILCSDGVWEFISSQEAINIIAQFPRTQVQKAAEALAQAAWKMWIQEEGNVVDDITVIVVYFPDNGQN
jgi:serine/threonine protein phosphatase PrpC